jgi:zinc transporter ZupT
VTPLQTAALCAAFGLSLVHLFAGKLRFLEVIPRSRWLSLASGVSVAYVFIRIFPELGEHQSRIEQTGNMGLPFLTNHVYLIALFGLAVFYGLERLVRASRMKQRRAEAGDTPSPGVFWLHIVSFSLYNVLVGYLLVHREVAGALSLLLFFLAMALHFLVNDYGLRHIHRDAYRRTGRWVLAAGVIWGWSAGIAVNVGLNAIAVLFSFLAGGVILNVLKEELPEERESRFWAFAAGAAGYTLILLLAR